MSSLIKRLQTLTPSLRPAVDQLRFFKTEARPNRRRSKAPSFTAKKSDEKSEWWVVDGEMHEIGEHVPPRERFVIPRDNVPNKRRKQLREQFMRRTRLVLKESEHEPWCKRYMELYQELRENWERLYWDEGFSKKIAHDHANYESAEEDDQDFNPYRGRRPDQMKDQQSFGRNRQGETWEKDQQSFGRNRQGETWEKVSQVRDKFEYDREKRMREKAFAPMNGRPSFDSPDSHFRNQPFDTQRYFRDERE